MIWTHLFSKTFKILSFQGYFDQDMLHSSIKQYIFSLPRTNCSCSVTFILSSTDALNLDKSKILTFGKVELVKTWLDTFFQVPSDRKIH